MELRRKLEHPEVKQAQLSAIARYDIILDASPWRAFSRWHSLGFHDAEREEAEEASPIGFSLLPAPEAQGEPVLVRVETLKERWPRLFARVSDLAAQGLAVAGFSGEEELGWCRRIVALWPVAPVLANGEAVGTLPEWKVHPAAERLDARLREPTLQDYLRILKVVAGQVRLLGEDRERPIEDVFVEMEVVRRDELDVRRARTGKKPTAAPLAERPDAGELEDELKSRWEEPLKREVLLRAGQSLSVGTRILLLGGAGMGKSTLLRWLACRTADAESALVPVWISHLAVPEDDFADQLAKQALESVGLSNEPGPARRQLAEAIASGRAHLFLDALDEASPTTRLSLVSRVAELGPGVGALIASRPIYELPQDSGFVRMELQGFVAGGPRTFLERYYGQALEVAPLLAELGSLADGERWMKTPVLLSLAASLSLRNRRLPDATLDLYREVVQALLEQTAIRSGMRNEAVRRQVEEARTRAIVLARGLLLSDSGEVRLGLPRGQVGDFLEASGLFTGDSWLRFAHLTLGEYLAACAPLDLKRERASWRTREPGARLLEVLPMAHALQQEAALEDALREAREQEADDHRMLSLVLRTVAYGGEGVARFCAAHAAKLVELVAARMQRASGRFGDDEQALMKDAERAFRVMRPHLRAGSDEQPGDEAPLLSLLESVGGLGTWAHILAWAAGFRPPTLQPLRRLRRMRDAIGPLLRAGLTPSELIEFSRGEDDKVLAAAVRSLREDPEARPLLRKLLRSAVSMEVEEAVIDTLAGDEEARPALRESVRDSAYSVRQAAVRALSRDEDARHVLPELSPPGSTEQRESGSTKPRPAPPKWMAAVKSSAKGALAGSAGLRSQLQKLLSEAQVDAEVLQALARDKKVAPALRMLLKAEDAKSRAKAASALTGDMEARADLRLLLKDRSEDVRAAAAAALAGDVPSSPALRSLLKADDWILRWELATFLAGEAGSKQALLTLARDREWFVSRTAQRALAMDAEMKFAMRCSLQSDNPDVRRTCAEVLAGDEESKPFLRVLLADEVADVRAAAADGLVGDTEARPTLRKLLEDKSASVRAAAAKALVGDTEARPGLRQLIRDTEESHWGHLVGEVAAKTLAADPESREYLRKLLKDPSGDVRRATAEALAGDIESIPALRPLLKDPDSDVREAAVRALAKDGESAPTLREILKARDEGVWRAAAKALVGDAESRPHFRGLLSENREMRLLAVRALRAGLRPSPGEALSSHVIPWESTGLVALKRLREVHASGSPLLKERLKAFIRAPQPLRLERNPDFAEALLGWLCARLGHASRDGQLTKGQLHGEFPLGMPERLFQPGATLLIRVSMDADDLPIERYLYPLHNLIEAWRVARHLRAENPPALVLACADVDFSDLQSALPELAPGRLVTGPTFFGFRVPRGQAPTGDPTLLLSASTLAADRWEQASQEERARHISVLAGLVDDPDLDPWVLVPLLARVGHLLPPGLRAALANRLPSSVEAAEQFLQQAARGLRQEE